MTSATDELLVDALADLQAFEEERDDIQSRDLEAISLAWSGLLREAIDGRRESGIEDVWLKAEEAYIGMDDANRAEFGRAMWCKPMSIHGPLQQNDDGKSDQQEVRSSIFVPLTARYVDAGAAKLGEILLPADDKAFSSEPTPVPELLDAKTNTEQLRHPETGQPLERDPKPEEVAPAVASPLGASVAAPGVSPTSGMGASGAAPAPPVDLSQAPGVPLQVKDVAEEQLALAKEKSDRAEKRMHDWLVECNYAGEMRKMIFESAKLGVSIAKGPFPVKTRHMKVQRVVAEDGSPGVEITMVEKTAPVIEYRSAWNIYPDPSCGENIQNGSHVFERDLLTKKQIVDLKRQPHYLKAELDAVLKQGPRSMLVQDTKPGSQTLSFDKRFEVWHFEGTLTREEYLTINPDACQPTHALHIEEQADQVFVSGTMINGRVVRAVPNTFINPTLSYFSMPWRRRDGHWAGVGIPEQISAAQRIVNGATRALMDNAGLASGLQIVMTAGVVQPADNSMAQSRIKYWYVTDTSTANDVRKAFQVFNFPSLQPQLQAVIDYGRLVAEESCNIPLISQGHSGDTTPDTLGQTQIQDNNANQLLRDIGYRFDDHITGPVMKKLYEYLLLDPDVPDSEKGDMLLNTHGSSSLVERAIQGQTIGDLAQIVRDPVFGLNPRKWILEYFRSKRLDVSKFKNSDAEQQKIDSQPPPPAPQVEVAKIRAEVDQMKMQLQQQMKDAELQLKQALGKQELDRDTVYVQAETQRTQAEHDARMRELDVKLQLAQLEYALKNNLQIQQVKADLAMNTQKLQVQRELSEKDRTAEVLKPPTEPAGKAPAGQSFQK